MITTILVIILRHAFGAIEQQECSWHASFHGRSGRRGGGAQAARDQESIHSASTKSEHVVKRGGSEAGNLGEYSGRFGSIGCYLGYQKPLNHPP